jgi:hypothetical protein
VIELLVRQSRREADLAKGAPTARQASSLSADILPDLRSFTSS